MTGRITLVGAGELMAAMSSIHRAAIKRLGAPPRAVFLDTTAGFETNVDAIGAKAVEYYSHHLQTDLTIASFRNRDRASTAEVASAVRAIRDANLIFAGPGSPTYAIRQWRDSPVWQAVIDSFEAGADLLFASAASISLGRYALPVYEVYKAGEDPYWADGLDIMAKLGLQLAIVPHFDDNSGGDNYDSRFCYMGALRFDDLQEKLPPEVTILGIDAYTCVCFDPNTRTAGVAGQGGVTLIGEAGVQRHEAGSELPFEAFRSGAREVVPTFDAGNVVSGYEHTDETSGGDTLSELTRYIDGLDALTGNQKVDLVARLKVLLDQPGAGASEETENHLLDLVIELREALRSAKRYDMADKARDLLDELGFEVGDTPQGARWSRR
jgi:cyanophycinase-like exopeptidase